MTNQLFKSRKRWLALIPLLANLYLIGKDKEHITISENLLARNGKGLGKDSWGLHILEEIVG